MFPQTKTYFGAESRPPVFERQFLIPLEKHITSLTLVGLEVSARNGSIALKTSVQSSSLLTSAVGINYCGKMKKSIACRMPSLCSIQSSIPGGL